MIDAVSAIFAFHFRASRWDWVVEFASAGGAVPGAVCCAIGFLFAFFFVIWAANASLLRFVVEWVESRAAFDQGTCARVWRGFIRHASAELGRFVEECLIPVAAFHKHCAGTCIHSSLPGRDLGGL